MTRETAKTFFQIHKNFEDEYIKVGKKTYLKFIDLVYDDFDTGKYNDFIDELKELRTICKDSIVGGEADGTCYLRDTEIMQKINKMIGDTK